MEYPVPKRPAKPKAPIPCSRCARTNEYVVPLPWLAYAPMEGGAIHRAASLFKAAS